MQEIKDTLQIKIDEAVALLSRESREAIGAVDWKKILLDISQKRQFDIDQTESLEIATELLLCGILSPEGYIGELKNQIRISESLIPLLINELNELIFKRIEKELLKRIEGNDIKPDLNDDNNFSIKSIPRDTNNPSIKYQAKIYGIGQRYKLSISQLGELERITNEVISGKMLSSKYEDELRPKITLEPEKFSELMSELNEHIFKDIRKSLKKNRGDEEKIPIPPYAAIPTTNRPAKIVKKVIPVGQEISAIKRQDPIVSQKVSQEKKDRSSKIIEIIEANKENDLTLQPKELPSSGKPVTEKEEKEYAQSGIEILNQPEDLSPTQAHDPYKEIF